MDHYEVRQWPSWYRHITLSMMALVWLTLARAGLDQALLAAFRRATTPPPPDPTPAAAVAPSAASPAPASDIADRVPAVAAALTHVPARVAHVAGACEASSTNVVPARAAEVAPKKPPVDAGRGLLGATCPLANWTVAEVRRLLTVVLPLPNHCPAFRLAWIHWRLRKREQTRRSHYRCRGHVAPPRETIPDTSS